MRNNEYTESQLSRRKDERGSAIVWAIFSMLLIAVLGAAFISTGMIAGNVSASSIQQAEAYYIAEAGLTRGMQVVGGTAASTTAYTALIGSHGGGSSHWTTGYTFGNGTYRFKVEDDHTTEAAIDGNNTGPDDDPAVDMNRTVVITGTGIGRDGSTVTLEATVTSTVTPGLLVNGPLDLSGNIDIGGTQIGTGGGAHANGPITFSGNWCVEGALSSTSTISGSGNGCAGVSFQPNQPSVIIPTYDIQADFKHRADFILGSDGWVRRQDGTPVSQGSWNGGGNWSWNNGSKTWSKSGNGMPSNVTVYVVGNLDISGNSGGTKTVTFIAEGSITVSGNNQTKGFLDSKYSYVAGKDLKISGNSDTSSGLHYSGDQFELTGNTTITGVVIVANQTDTRFPLPSGPNPVARHNGGTRISGNSTINYTAGLFDERAVTVSWREIRN